MLLCVDRWKGLYDNIRLFYRLQIGCFLQRFYNHHITPELFSYDGRTFKATVALAARLLQDKSQHTNSAGAVVWICALHLLLFEITASYLKSQVQDESLKSSADTIPEVLQKSRASNTDNKYRSFWGRWSSWCHRFPEFDEFPARPHHVILLFVAMVQSNESYFSIESVFYAIKHFHNVSGQAHPTESRWATSWMQPRGHDMFKTKKQK